jgi:hypothetical protein
MEEIRMTPNASPIMMSMSEIRALLQTGQVEVRRRVRNVPIALKPRVRRVADVLWIRESISTRREELTVRIRYPADQGQGEGRVRVIPIGEADRRFATRGYRTWPARYCPRWASRLTVSVTAAAIETEVDHQVSVLQLQLKERL